MIVLLDSEIIFIGKIILKHVNFNDNISEKMKDKISNFWNNDVKSKNETIYNDQVLRFVRINPNNNAEIEVSYTDYKNIIIDREFLNSSLNISQVGVSGLVINKNGLDSLILFAKRSSNVTEYPNFYELVPSGNLDKSVLSNDGTINYIAKILQEFEEETGLLSSAITNITPFCFVRDNKNHVFDVCCVLEINVDPKILTDSFKTVSEFNSPYFVSLENLNSFVCENESNIVPTSKAIVECFLQNYKNDFQ